MRIKKNEKVEKENENKNGHENENENENENEDDDDDIIKILAPSNEYAETKNQIEKNIITKKLNDCLDEIIDKSKSFEDQIEPIRKKEHIKEYYLINDFGYKELKFKIFEVRIAHLSNEINEDLFEQLFDYKFETLANKLINTTNKE